MTGKSTVAKMLRDKIPNSVWINVDRLKRFFKDFYRKKSPRREREALYKAVKEMVRVFLEENYSVIVEGLFIETKGIDLMVDLARKGRVPYEIFEFYAPREILIKRDSERNMSVIGGLKVLDRLTKEVLSNPCPQAVKINTSKYSAEECADLILKKIQSKQRRQ